MWHMCVSVTSLKVDLAIPYKDQYAHSKLYHTGPEVETTEKHSSPATK